MADIKYYGLESHFNENVTFYKDVNINGNLNYDSLTVRNLTVREQATLGTVKISSGIVTAISGIATYYGDGSNLQVNGTSLSSAISAAVPTGVILMWSGSIVTIPTGWVLCDGSNGTPDLRSRFVVGAGTDTANTWSFNTSTGAQTFTNSQTSPNVGASGGEIAHQLSTSEMPAHTHGYTDRTNEGTGGGQGGGGANTGTTTLSKTTDSTGSNLYHENRPPYYALAFIMKT